MNSEINHIKTTFTREISENNCGLACLASITKYYGGSVTQEDLVSTSGTSLQGTSLLGLLHAAQKIGFEAEGFEAEIENLKETKKPVILNIIKESNQMYYVVCYGYNGRFLIGDPGWGILHYTENELRAVWKTKKLLELTPNKDLIKEQDTIIQKKTWLKQLLKEDIIILGIAVFLGIFMAVMSLAVAVFSQKLIDYYIPSKNVNKLITGLVLLAIILIINAYFGYVKGFLTIKQSKDFNIRLIHRFYNSILAFPKAFFESVKTGQLITRINDNQRIQRSVTFLTGSIIVDLLLVFIATIFIFTYSITIGIVAIFSIPLFMFLILKYNKKINNAQEAVMNANAACECNYLDAVQGISVIKNMNKESFFTRIIMNSYNNLQESIYRLGRNGNNLGFMTQLISILILISVISTGSFLVLNGFLKTGELIAIIFISSTLTTSLTSLTMANIQLQEAKVAFDRIFEIANSKPEINAIDEQKKQDIDLKFSELIITDLSFRFPGRGQLLKKMSMKASKGQLVALIGENGSGKSTLLQVLQRDYEYESGKILIDGNDLNNIKIASWRNNIGIVSQNIKLFSGTLAYNICMDSNQEEIKEVVNFCNSYGFNKYFERLPQQYYTILGENGINLSAGQQQLVALARALYQKPKLLLLDEPTSAMDKNTELFVFDLLNKIKSEMMIVLFTHRDQLSQKSDVAYKIENGKIEKVSNF